MRLTSRAFIGVLTVLSFWTQGSLATPLDNQALESGAKTTDLTTVFDANNLMMVVSNIGSFAYDPTQTYGSGAGLYYPKGTNYPLAYAGGLWVGAHIAKFTVVTAAEYNFDYATGPIVNGTFLPDNDAFRVYKIAPGDTPLSNPDYHDWPYALGAPVVTDEYGNVSVGPGGLPIPAVRGDQTLWSVFNDVDPSRRLSDPGTNYTNQLGLEAQMLTWGYDRPGPLENTVFLHYTLINKGDSVLHQTYVTLWADPDVGAGGDDLFGCDTNLALGYCYNDGADAVYGGSPPAIGFLLLEGPIVPSPGNVAIVNGRSVPGFRNLPMSVANTYYNGQDPNSPILAYALMSGFSHDDFYQINPQTGDTATHIFPGDPIAGTGWIDTDPSDRRMMISAGEFEMAPGDTQHVTAAIVVGDGINPKNSIFRLKQSAQYIREFYRTNYRDPVDMDVDIIPGECPNILYERRLRPVNIPTSSSLGYPNPPVSVAVHGNAEFDVSSIVADQLSLAGVFPYNYYITHAGAPGTAFDTRCLCERDRSDGFDDLILQYDRAALFTALGPYTHGEKRRLELTGYTQGGITLTGDDCITLQETDYVIVSPQTPAVHDKSGLVVRSGYPNPFNASVVIEFEITSDEDVRASVYDILGRPIANLLDDHFAAGLHRITWTGVDDRGQSVSSGMYFVRVQTQSATSVRKVMLIK